MINLCIYTSSWYLFVLALIYPIINHYMIVFLLEYSAKKNLITLMRICMEMFLIVIKMSKCISFFFFFCSDFNLSYN